VRKQRQEVKDRNIEAKEHQSREARKQKQLTELYNIVFASPEGQEVLRDICHSIVDYHGPGTLMNPQSGELNSKCMEYIEGKKTVYRKIRERLKSTTLKKVEYL